MSRNLVELVQFYINKNKERRRKPVIDGVPLAKELFHRLDIDSRDRIRESNIDVETLPNFIQERMGQRFLLLKWYKILSEAEGDRIDTVLCVAGITEKDMSQYEREDQPELYDIAEDIVK